MDDFALPVEVIDANMYNFQCPKNNQSLISEFLWEFKGLLYAIPTIILYFLVLTAIQLKKTYFSSTFVHLFSLSCVFNILCWSGDFTFTTVFGYSPLCEHIVGLNHTYYLSIPYFMYNFFPVANFVCSTAIALHQLTAVYRPLIVDTVWTKLRSWVTFLTIIIPSFMGIHIILGYMMTIPMPNGTIYIKVDHFFSEIDFMTAPLMNSIAGTVFFLIISLATLASVARICFICDQRVQMRVFLVACFMCCSSLIFGVYQIFLFYSRFILKDDYAINQVVYHRTIVADLCFLPLPWFVILVNKRIRESLFRFEKRKSRSQTQATRIVRSTMTTSTWNSR